jgi:hypothetical protein
MIVPVLALVTAAGPACAGFPPAENPAEPPRSMPLFTNVPP